MPQQKKISAENNFIGGLKTEFTGLNFPENAATDTDNCIYGVIGDVVRRPGFDFETNYDTLTHSVLDGVVSSHHWLNAGGDGDTQVFVQQIGSKLYFFKSSDATIANPLSNQLLASTVDIAQFLVTSSDEDSTLASCEFSDGNGYLFVYHPMCDPFYCTYEDGVITPYRIEVKIRDFVGVKDGLGLTTRPAELSDEHSYNLQNQGWTGGALWSATFVSAEAGAGYPPLSFTSNGFRGRGPSTGTHTWTVPAGLPIETGQGVQFNYSMVALIYNIWEAEWFYGTETGTGKGIVISYEGTVLTVNITSVSPVIWADFYELNFDASPITYVLSADASTNTIQTWHDQLGTYPSNADVWWLYKSATTTYINNSSGSVATTVDVFSPQTTSPYIIAPSTPAPKGHFIVKAFDQVAGELTSYTTLRRPRTGTWFQGRVWYTGVDASQSATSDRDFYTWTENLYFSQIVEGVDDFDKCYQENDPTDEKLFDLLPSDGGVITIQGCGSVYKLVPIQNGMLVFAANGIWFVTGSSGIGFTANDYTITKISNVRSISPYSFVNVNGLPMFWNEEAIYEVVPAQQGSGLVVNPVTTSTIQSYYENIPYQQKKVARGAYNPIDYVAQWVYGGVGNVTRPTVPETVSSSGKFVGLSNNAQLQPSITSEDGVTWTWSREAEPAHSVAYQGMCYSPELQLFVATGYRDDGKLIKTSPDGETWTEIEMADPLVHGGLSGICWSPDLSLFVAVTSDDVLDCVATSPDGSTWTFRTAPAGSWRDVEWSSELGLFVAIGDVSTNSVDTQHYGMYSSDGITWTASTMPNDGTINWHLGGLVWAEDLGLFVALGGTNGGLSRRIATTPDGINWTLQTVPAAHQGTGGIAWGREIGTLVVTSAGGEIAYSTDAINWTNVTLVASQPESYSGVAWSPELGIFAAVQYGGEPPMHFITSPDGINWTSQAAEAYIDYGLITIYALVWAPGSDIVPGTFVLCRTDGAGSINFETSDTDEAQTFTAITDPPQSDVASFWGGGYGNGLFVFAGSGNDDTFEGKIATSEDGLEWTLRNNSFGINGKGFCAAYGNGTYVVGGYDGSFLQAGHIETSTDGITWTPRTTHFDTGSGGVVYGVAYGNSIWVAVGESEGSVGHIERSLDGGVTWVSSSTDVSGGLALLAVTYGNGLFVAVGGDGTDGFKILTSPDGDVWTTYTGSGTLPNNSTTDRLNGITYGIGKFVATGAYFGASGRRGAILTSTDGITWTDQPDHPFINSNDLIRCATNDGRVFAVGGINQSVGTMVAWSTNGTHWITADLGASVTGVVWGLAASPYQTVEQAAGDNLSVIFPEIAHDKVLNYNTLTKAFYPWSITQGDNTPLIFDVKYIQNPGGTNSSPEGMFKYPTSQDITSEDVIFTFSECSDTSYVDWNQTVSGGLEYDSYFVTGYKLHGQALREWQPEYLFIYSRNEVPTAYTVQGIWNFANTGNSGKISRKQLINIRKPQFDMGVNKVRIRGAGLALQLKFASSHDKPFDIMGWTMMENQNVNE